MIDIFGGDSDDMRSSIPFVWHIDGAEAIRGSICSGREGVTLRIDPTVIVAHWPAWLRAIATFGPHGGEVILRLDPHSESDADTDGVPALGIKGAHARRAFAALLQAMADALASRCPLPSPEYRQAFDICAGQARALVAQAVGIAPTPADLPELFLPSLLPIVIDDVNFDAARQHVRLTYRLPRVMGWWTEGCSLRLFRSEHVFGLEFRALADDHLPHPLRAACIEDAFGPLVRFTIDRGGDGVVFEGRTEDREAVRLIQAIARQVSSDMTAPDVSRPFTGFEAAPWQHWLAAFPDLLASPMAIPLENAPSC